MSEYIKQTWVDGETPVDAEHMNHIEEGVAAAHKAIAELPEIPEIPKIPVVDNTLSVPGAAADAAAVGAKVTALTEEIGNKQPAGKYVQTVNGVAPDAIGNVQVSADGSGSAADSAQKYGTYTVWDYATEMQPNKSAAIYKAAGEVIAAPVTSSQFSYFEVACAEGQTFEIKGDANQSVGLWTFVDENRAVIEHNPYNENSAYDNPVRAVAPAGAAKLLVNMKNTHIGYLVRIGESALKLIEDAESTGGKFADMNGLYAAKDYTHRFINGRALAFDTVGMTVNAMGYSSPAYRYLEAECTEGDVFEVQGYSNRDDSKRRWCFVDADRKVISRSTLNVIDTMYRPYRLVAPAGAAKLIYVCLIDGYDKTHVTKLGKYTETPQTIAVSNSDEYKYIMPRWAEIEPFSEKAFTNEQNYTSFSNIYQAFHALNKDGVIEEINMSTDYLAANTDDAIPGGISGITDGGMYMWHVIPPVSDSQRFTPKYKRAKVMLLGGIHGGEKKSVWDLYFMLKDIHDGAKSRAISILSNFFDLYIVPLCNPYGIQNNDRLNHNSINLARDFYNLEWKATTGSGASYNSQYETRCISWWIDQIRPDIFCDHHTSTGDNSAEFDGEHFLAWGDSPIASIISLIEETLVDLSPEIREQYSDYFGNYGMVYGFAAEPETYLTMGLPQYCAHEKGAIACLFEVVHTVLWDGVQIIDGTNEKQTDLMSIDYYLWINFLMRFLREAVDMLNGKVRY